MYGKLIVFNNIRETKMIIDSRESNGRWRGFELLLKRSFHLAVVRHYDETRINDIESVFELW